MRRRCSGCIRWCSFVSEIGGEDMKTIFLSEAGEGKNKQVYMQSACSGGTGTFIEKTARKLQISPERLARMAYDGYALHRISSKCGIFAEADANTLLKSGVPVEEIMASLFEAVVHQNLATLTKGNTPMPQVLLLGGPNLFFGGLQQAWRHHLARLWSERGVPMPHGLDANSAIIVPEDALYYAALGCAEVEPDEAEGATLSGDGKAALVDRRWASTIARRPKDGGDWSPMRRNSAAFRRRVPRYPAPQDCDVQPG